ncbi:MAG: C4-type zinc ribbon domain-containing protein [Myxococcales bacterium]|nr:C4-type zinc ribbon domain-containing protein [Polyangiaceae bacterium]MDW8248366.1 C4-type zinc ribbon domain-containing protein [Myxococcales bacterium]
MTPQEKLAQHIQVLEALAAVDRELMTLETQIREGQGSLDMLRQELASLDDKLSRERKSLEEMIQMAGELHTEVRQMTAQIERSKEKASRARNDREALTAEREQDELRRMQRDREEEVKKIEALIDAAKKSIGDLQNKRERIHGELTSSEGSTSSNLAETRQQRETKLAERVEISKKLPQPIFKRYEAILKKKGFALARTTDGTCQACHVALPPQFFQKLLRREALEECPMCHRLLYFYQETP